MLSSRLVRKLDTNELSPLSVPPVFALPLVRFDIIFVRHGQPLTTPRYPNNANFSVNDGQNYRLFGRLANCSGKGQNPR